MHPPWLSILLFATSLSLGVQIPDGLPRSAYPTDTTSTDTNLLSTRVSQLTITQSPASIVKRVVLPVVISICASCALALVAYLIFRRRKSLARKALDREDVVRPYKNLHTTSEPATLSKLAPEAKAVSPSEGNSNVEAISASGTSERTRIDSSKNGTVERNVASQSEWEAVQRAAEDVGLAPRALLALLNRPQDTPPPYA